MTWILTLDSLRRVDYLAKSVTRISGVAPATAREGTGAQSFLLVAPDPLVPGLPLTIAWSVHAVGRVRTTVTSTVIGWWESPAAPLGEWTASGVQVQRAGRDVLMAPTTHAAFGLAAVLDSKPLGSATDVPTFVSQGRDVVAGTDLIGTATNPDTATEVASILSRHPAAQTLAPGLAVAADPTIGEFRIMPDWLFTHDDRPWVTRVAAAARIAGIAARVDGNEMAWRLDASYRAVNFHIRNDSATCRVELLGQELTLESGDLDGPLTAIGHVTRVIDQLGDELLLQLALEHVERRRGPS